MPAQQAKPRNRNYSFQNSRRLPIKKMTVVNGVQIPAMPGSCFHAILFILALHKNEFCAWDIIFETVENKIQQYGGKKAWKKFKGKMGVQKYRKRIKNNVRTLTRTGKDCYGYRLHERGMGIYLFKDGAMLLTGGDLVRTGFGYDVHFPDGRKLQKRPHGISLTWNEYQLFFEMKLIDKSCKLLNHDGIKQSRMKAHIMNRALRCESYGRMPVAVVLGDGYDQHTADRLEGLGLVVNRTTGDNVLLGTMEAINMIDLKNDKDVVDVQLRVGI